MRSLLFLLRVSYPGGSMCHRSINLSINLRNVRDTAASPMLSIIVLDMMLQSLSIESITPTNCLFAPLVSWNRSLILSAKPIILDLVANALSLRSIAFDSCTYLIQKTVIRNTIKVSH